MHLGFEIFVFGFFIILFFIFQLARWNRKKYLKNRISIPLPIQYDKSNLNTIIEFDEFDFIYTMIGDVFSLDITLLKLDDKIGDISKIDGWFFGDNTDELISRIQSRYGCAISDKLEDNTTIEKMIVYIRENDG